MGHRGGMSKSSRGAAVLRAARADAKLTQAELGHRSGVSVRTIRGLERGEILRPQIATLQQLALGLDLGPRAQTEFMHGWATEGPASFDGLLVDPSMSEMEQIDSLTRAGLGNYRVISQIWRTHVSADRRLSRTACHSSICAVEDGLDRVFNVQVGDQSSSAKDLEFTPLLGCHLISRRFFPESDVVVFEVGLPEALPKGANHAYAYEVCDTGHGRRGPGSDGFVWGPTHTARSIVVSVEFEVCPARITHVEKAPGEDFRFLEEARLDAENRTTLVLEDVGPGAFGFSWEW